MGPARARKLGGFIVGMVVIGALAGATAAIVRAGRDLTPRERAACPPPPIKGPGLTRLPIGGNPISAVADGDALWVLQESGARAFSIVRIDTRTDGLVGQPIPLPPDVGRFAVLSGDLWVTVSPATQGNQPLRTGSVLRISGTTGRVVGTIPVGRAPLSVASGFGSAWVMNSGDGTISRVDPATNRVVALIAVGWDPSGAVAGAGALWVNTNGAPPSAVRIDPMTNHVAAIIPNFHVQAIDGRVVWGSGAVSPNGGIVPLDPATNRIGSSSYATDIAPATLVAHNGRVWVGKWFFYCSQHYPVPEGPAIVAFELFELDPSTMRPITKPFAIAYGPTTPVYADGALWVADSSLGDDVLRIDLALAFHN